MKPKPTPDKTQLNFFQKDLLEQLDPKQPLMLLAKQIPWTYLEKEFASYYAKRGRPAKPIRLMIGLLIIKQIENLSDARVVEAWKQNPYYQAFCGEKFFRWDAPCEPSELTHFRKRIGAEGAEKILQISIAIHGKAAQENELVIDTTVQEKNITYPTDTKTRLKVIEHCHKWATKENIQLRQTFRRKLKKLKRLIRFDKVKKNIDKIDLAKSEIQAIANTLLNEIARKLPKHKQSIYKEKLDIYRRAVNQKKDDHSKVYSLHEPGVNCIIKGKEHKKFEFGCKVAIAMTKNTGIVTGVKSFSWNIFDGDVTAYVLEQIDRIRNTLPQRFFADRGFRGRQSVKGIPVEIPDIPNSSTTAYEKLKARKNFGRRCAIEPIIGHIKNDFRMAKNYLKGIIGDEINAMLAGAAFNFNKWMRLAAERLYKLYFLTLFHIKFIIKVLLKFFEYYNINFKYC